MRDDMLKSILSDLNGSPADIEAYAVISADGLMMASLLPAGLEEERIGAMNAVMAKASAKPGLIFLDVRRASENFARIV